MNVTEIQAKQKEYAEALKDGRTPQNGLFLMECAKVEMLVEIAAQLAELNDNLRARGGF